MLLFLASVCRQLGLGLYIDRYIWKMLCHNRRFAYQLLTLPLWVDPSFPTPFSFLSHTALNIIIIDHFYIALFSALKQTHCAHVTCWFWISDCIFFIYIYNLYLSLYIHMSHVILNEWLAVYSTFLISTCMVYWQLYWFSCNMAGATATAAISVQVLCTR